MKTHFFIGLSLLFFSQIALAEGGCPPGMYPPNPSNTAVCYPFPDNQPQQQEQPQAPRGYWESRYGDIAIDSVRGKLGGSSNLKTAQAATDVALKNCYARGNGGNKDCKAIFLHYNECASVAWGDEGNAINTGSSLFDSDTRALQACSKKYANCVVVYNACSLPVWFDN